MKIKMHESKISLYLSINNLNNVKTISQTMNRKVHLIKGTDLFPS